MWVRKQCVPLTEEQFYDYTLSEKYFLCQRCVATAAKAYLGKCDIK